jgi:hypothetical protein
MEAKIKLKGLEGWRDVDICLSTSDLLKYRQICFKEFNAYIEREKKQFDGGILGFTPVTFTEFWLKNNGIALPLGFDRFPILYASFQKIKYMNDNGKWITLPLLYKFPKEG